ncbi:MAG: hypothetical protein IPJ88_16285 [Myxococcales bacterium]|nr:MAG: hypothetical protein IPJ88_16285 [Myxococcales bacterium]
MKTVYFVAILCFFCLACETVIESRLSEEQADQVLKALAAQGIHATKDSRNVGLSRGRYQVKVSNSQAPLALQTLRSLALPTKGMDSHRVPQKQNHLFPVRGIKRSLRKLSGREIRAELVIDRRCCSSRCAFSFAQQQLWEDSSSSSSRASVLIKFQKLPSSLGDEKIKEFVAGAVQGLRPDNVTVIMLAVPHLVHKPQVLRWVGPFEVSVASANLLQGLLGLLFGVCLLLASMLVLVWRVRRAARPSL